MAERGLELTYETIRKWCLKFGTTYAKQLAASGSMVGAAAETSVATGTEISAESFSEMSAASAIAGGAAGGFTAGFLASGGNFQAGLDGAADGAIFSGLNSMAQVNNWGAVATIGANSIAGGVMTRAQGRELYFGNERCFYHASCCIGLSRGSRLGG